MAASVFWIRSAGLSGERHRSFLHKPRSWHRFAGPWLFQRTMTISISGAAFFIVQKAGKHHVAIWMFKFWVDRLRTARWFLPRFTAHLTANTFGTSKVS